MEAKWDTICRIRYEVIGKIVGLQECDAGNDFVKKRFLAAFIEE